MQVIHRLTIYNPKLSTALLFIGNLCVKVNLAQRLIIMFIMTTLLQSEQKRKRPPRQR